jgi:hypothetical protein
MYTQTMAISLSAWRADDDNRRVLAVLTYLNT